ncbi:MAG: HAD family phosphatase, partial [Candidatus Omnitrophica bacterium]|nr:HAD family phosphatase [Candidatus Omnitrophota bacterium]
AWRRIYAREGLKVTSCEIYLREGQPGYRTIKEILGDHKIPFDEKRARRMLAAKEKYFKAIVSRRFVPGAKGFLKFLGQRGVTAALVTGTARHEAEEILSKAFLRRFAVTVTGDEARRGKPHPEPYLLALKRLHVRAKDAVVIENAPCGIHSAKRAGMKCIALETSLSRVYLKDADFIFSSYRDLRNHLEFEAIRKD